MVDCKQRQAPAKINKAMSLPAKTGRRCWIHANFVGDVREDLCEAAKNSSSTPRVGGIHIDWNLAVLLLTTGHRRQ